MRTLDPLVLEQIPLDFEGRLEDLAPSAGSILAGRREWSESVALSTEPVDLIVPVTSAQEAEARRLLTWLGRQRPRAPTLAIVPQASRVLSPTSEAVDDFVRLRLRPRDPAADGPDPGSLRSRRSSRSRTRLIRRSG